jgi:hypothetical protein
VSLDTFDCPECGAKLRRSAAPAPGVRVRCPKCQAAFPVPAASAAFADEPAPDREEAGAPEPRERPAGPAITATPSDEGARAWRPRDEGDEDRGSRRRWRDEDEEDEDHGPRPRHDGDEEGEDGGELPSRYRIDMSAWFSCASQHYTSVLGPAVGFLALCAVAFVALAIVQALVGVAAVFVLATMNNVQPELGLALGQVAQEGIGLLANALVFTPLLAGLTKVSLAQLGGRRWSFGDYFGGFRHYLAFVVLGLVNSLLLLPVQGGMTLIQVGMAAEWFDGIELPLLGYAAVLT